MDGTHFHVSHVSREELLTMRKKQKTLWTILLILTLVALTYPQATNAGSTNNVKFTAYAYGNTMDAGTTIVWSDVAVHVGYTPNVGTRVYYNSSLPLINWHDQLTYLGSSMINDHGDLGNVEPWDWMDLYHGRWYYKYTYSGCAGRCLPGDGPCSSSQYTDSCDNAWDFGVKYRNITW